MSLAISDRKTERRLAHELPYQRDNEASIARSMERGQMPRNFDALILWLREVSADELPGRLHKQELWREHAKRGERAGAGSRLGTLAYDGQFESVLYGEPSDLDEDGYYQRPFRALLSRWRMKRWSVPAHHLQTLGTLLQDPVSGGWRRYVNQLGMDEQVGRMMLEQCIRDAWHEYQSQRMLT